MPHYQAGLNETMERYGVTIKAVKITNVNLPRSLEKTLEQRTSYALRSIPRTHS